VGLQLQRNGKPYKELVKIAHPPIIRRAARRCAGWSEGFCTQPLRRYRCHGEVMSYIDVLYLGLLLVAFLGFAAALFYFWRRFSNRNPPTRLESKRFRREENS